MAESFSETITPHEGTAPLNGRIIGALESDEWGRYYKLRVPDNGLWWIEGDDLGREEGRYQDYWITDQSDSSRFRLMDWVRAQPIFRGQFCPYPRDEGQQAAIERYGSKEPLLHYDYEIKLIEPIAVDFFLEKASARQEPFAGRDDLHPLKEDPATLQLRITNNREIDQLLVQWRGDLWLLWDAFDLNARPQPQGDKAQIYICSCGEWGCGSILAWVEKDESRNVVVWREVEMLGEGSSHLGPSLSFDLDAYRSADHQVRKHWKR